MGPWVSDFTSLGLPVSTGQMSGSVVHMAAAGMDSSLDLAVLGVG